MAWVSFVISATQPSSVHLQHDIAITLFAVCHTLQPYAALEEDDSAIASLLPNQPVLLREKVNKVLFALLMQTAPCTQGMLQTGALL